MNINKLFIYFAVLFVSACTVPEESLSLESPDGNLRLELQTEKELSYQVWYSGSELLQPSTLGFTFKNEPALGPSLEVINVQKKNVDSSWVPVLKRYDTIRNHYNELKIALEEKKFPGRSLNLEIRAYNDGIAFRYIFPDESNLTRIIMDERTSFNFAGDHTCWAADYQVYDSHQESEFVEKKLSNITEEAVTGLPITIAVDDEYYCAITEAALVDYAGMYLKPAPQLGKYVLKTQLAPRHDQPEEGEKVHFSGIHNTPWRVIMTGDMPGNLIESEIIQNLNEACMIEETDWVQPGLSAWDHWWSGEVKMEQEVIMEYIDLAAEMGWPYMLIDWQWYGEFNLPDADITRVAPQLNMPEILEYAHDRNVKCWLWLYWTDVDRSDFNAACKLYKSWGIAGVKIDFMARDDQEMVNWYQEIVKTAARNQLMVDFHGAYKPTGWRRTYPNLLTREGVLGNEYNKWSMRITPDHNCVLPFTRMLAGPMDYTPGGFLNTARGKFKPQSPTMVQGTRAHTLAQFVVYDSPYLVACDHPSNYRDETGIGFLQEVSTVWDDTRVINGAIGEYITMARRDGNRWFIGSMTNSDARNLEITLDFLDEGKTYELVGYSDTDNSYMNATSVEKSTSTATKGSTVSIKMAPGGGYAAFLVPI